MIKSSIWTIAGCMALCLSACKGKPGKVEVKEDAYYLLVGSYAPAEDEGIKVYAFDQQTGQNQYLSGLKGISNPSYLQATEDGSKVYAVSENEGKDAAVCALQFHKEKSALSLLDRKPTDGGAPCYVAISPQENYVVAANYSGGSISVFPVGEDGRLEACRLISFTGKGADAERQSQPHLHCALFTPDAHYMLASDLGTDKIHVFPLDASLGYPKTEDMFDISLAAGSGPRHLALSPEGKQIYVMTELSGEVVALSYDEEKLDTMQCVLADTCRAGGGADIHVSPDGHFVYASCRLQNDGIAIFEVSEDGSLTKVGYQPTGIHPRNFVITPNGKFLLVACRDSNVIEVYERDADTGLLEKTGIKIETPKPVCLKFVKR